MAENFSSMLTMCVKATLLNKGTVAREVSSSSPNLDEAKISARNQVNRVDLRGVR